MVPLLDPIDGPSVGVDEGGPVGESVDGGEDNAGWNQHPHQ